MDIREAISKEIFLESDGYRSYANYVQKAQLALAGHSYKSARFYLEMALEFSENRVSYRLPVLRMLSRITGENEVKKQYGDLYE
jgi:hypothetical protein